MYSPRGGGALCQASRDLCARVKAVDRQWLPRYLGVLYRTSLFDPHLQGVFTAGAVLVPVPGCMPSGDAPWAAGKLALALETLGFPGHVWAGLERRFAVRRSATAPRGERPSVREHYDSFRVAHPPEAIGRILLIDDVITKGRTLLAASMRLQERFPHAEVRAFALVRTVGFRGRLERLIEPCCGVIRWGAGDARREP